MSPIKPSEDNSNKYNEAGNYKVLRKLGQGAIGTVNLVKHVQRKEVFALK